MRKMLALISRAKTQDHHRSPGVVTSFEELYNPIRVPPYNTLSFDLECNKSNYVNDVNMLVWIPSMKIKTKDLLLNG